MELGIENDYASLLQLLNDHSGYSTNIIHHVKNHIIPHLEHRHLFVDVGPGIGIVAKAVAKYFEQCILVGPRKQLRQKVSWPGVVVIPEAYSEVQFDSPVSFMLAAHLFHSVPLAEWSLLVKKMLSELVPGGVLMLSTSAPRGMRHHLCDQLNPDYLHSGHLKGVLESLSLDYTVQESPVIFTTDTPERMAEILRFIVADICFPPKGLDGLSEGELVEFDSLILNVAHSLETVRHNYHFRQEDDWFFLQKPA